MRQMPPSSDDFRPPQHQSRIVGSVDGRVRRLSGFLKNHHVPDGYHAAAQAFVRRVGHDEVKSAADRLYQDIRTLFAYKRREFDYSCEDGFACIKTPDFDLHLRIDQSDTDAKNYRLTTEIVALHNDRIRTDDRFRACFNHHCETLVVEFPLAIDVDAKIDAIEALPEVASFLDYEPDGSAFELKLPEQDLHIQVNECEMIFRLLTHRNLGKLLDHSQKAFDILAAAGLTPGTPRLSEM